MDRTPTDLERVFAAIRAWTARVYPGASRVAVVIHLPGDPEPVRLAVPPAAPAPQPEVVAERGALDAQRHPGARHSADFRSISWFGQGYSFTEAQARAVQLLWQSWMQGTPDVGDKLLVKAAGSESTRLVDIFRDSAAWSTLIVEGATRGTHRLADPGEQEEGEPDGA